MQPVIGQKGMPGHKARQCNLACPCSARQSAQLRCCEPVCESWRQAFHVVQSVAAKTTISNAQESAAMAGLCQAGGCTTASAGLRGW